MEQQFQLKHYANLNLFEQNMMPAEDRAWWMKRIEKEMKDKAEAEKNQMGSRPHIPHR